ncbi:MAG: TIGR01777 family protein [Gemmatimonadetes bacterium]|nr:TIGR01777 family protein [Gemmatimonadota bacterium]
METFVRRSQIDISPRELFRWHERPGAFLRLAPPWRDVSLEAFEGIEDGDRAVIRLGLGPARIRWVAEHFGFEAGRQFCDRQVRGPFRAWTHTHRMEPDGERGSVLVDDIRYELPLGALGRAVAGRSIRRELDAQFARRHSVTRHDVESHARYNPDGRHLRIAVSGASGLVGSTLVSFLTAGGHTVQKLVRRPVHSPDEIEWNPKTGRVDVARMEDLDAVVHLAGESLFALRWTEEKKRRILSSRVEGTKLLSSALASLDRPPAALISASAIGFYGDRGDELLDETSGPAKPASFLARVTLAWEAATEIASRAGIRTAHARLGVVLSPRGGALATMLPAFRLALGGRLGSRDQWFSWVDLDDVVGSIYHLIMTEVEGPVNVTSPEPVTMEAYTRTLARVLRRPAFMPLPNSLVRIAAGELADEMLLASARVVPRRLQKTGYEFRSEGLEQALRSQLGRPASDRGP